MSSSSDEQPQIVFNDGSSSSEFNDNERINLSSDEAQPPTKKRKIEASRKRKIQQVISDDEEDEEDDFQEQVMQEFPHQPETTSTDTMWIKSIYLENFMCHTQFHLDLNENINFIVGQNGSGKSSVLSAIILALGGSSAFTDRGRGQKNLIKDGHKSATIRLTIDNTKCPFEPSKFGNVVILERRLDQQAGHWKLLNQSGECIYKDKKTVMMMIEDHFNIVVNNPLNVLTQENAKKFLFSSSSKHKYDFFKKATRLSEVEEWYLTACTHYNNSKAIIKQKKQNLALLEAKKNESEAVLTRVRAAQDASEQITSILLKMVWAMVIDYEKKIQILENDILKIESNLTETQANVDEAMTDYSKAKDDLAALIEKESEILDIADPNATKTEILKNAIKSKHSKIKEMQHKKQDMTSKLELARCRLITLQTKLEKENEQFSNTQKSQFDSLQTQLQSFESQRQGLLTDVDEKQRDIEKYTKMMESSQIQQKQQELKNLKSSEHKNRKLLEELQSANNNQMNTLGGAQMQTLLNKISQAQWKHDPIGPIGSHVKIKTQYTQYHRLLDSILAQSMKDFIVFDAKDQHQLQSLINQFQWRGGPPGINYRSRELFDFTNGLNSSCTTLFSILDISNDFVTRHLIDAFKIESTAFYNNRELATSAITPSYPPKISKVYYPASNSNSVAGYETGIQRGGKYSRYQAVHRGPSPFVSSQESLILETREILVTCTNQLKVANLEISKLEQQKKQYAHTLAILKNDLESKQRNVHTLNHQIKKTQHNLEKQQNENQGLLQQIKEATDNVTNVKQQVLQYDKNIEETQSLIEQDKNNILNLENNANTHQNELVELQHHQRRVKEQLHANKTRFIMFKESQKKENLHLEKTKEQLQEAQEKYNRYLTQANTSGNRVEVKESIEKLSAMKNQLEQEKLEIEEKEKVTYQSAVTEHRYRLREYTNAKELMDNFVAILRCLKSGLLIRQEKLTHHKNAVTASAKQSFVQLASRRGYSGSLEIDHEEGTLDIKLAVEMDQILRLQNKKKMVTRDVKSLSGGEKSYASVCFLCSLWAHVPSPIRCLDVN